MPHLVAMGSSASSRDLNKPSKTYSQDFQTSEQDRAAAEQQATDEHSSGYTNIDEEKGNTIPRADGGRDAWLFLAGCFVFEALIWGESVLSSPQKPCTSKLP
jgi:hypothetical protein